MRRTVLFWVPSAVPTAGAASADPERGLAPPQSTDCARAVPKVPEPGWAVPRVRGSAAAPWARLGSGSGAFPSSQAFSAVSQPSPGAALPCRVPAVPGVGSVQAQSPQQPLRVPSSLLPVPFQAVVASCKGH